MDGAIVKRCPLCGGKPKFVHYVFPYDQFPYYWSVTENGYEPVILMKRLECEKCRATTPELTISMDASIENWNSGRVVQYYTEELPYSIEEEKNSEEDCKVLRK